MNNLTIRDSIAAEETVLGYSGLTVGEGLTEYGKQIVIAPEINNINDGIKTVVIDNSGIYLPSGTSKCQTYLRPVKLNIDDKNGGGCVSLDAEELYWSGSGMISVYTSLYFKQSNNKYKFNFDKAISLGLLVKES